MADCVGCVGCGGLDCAEVTQEQRDDYQKERSENG